jgi:hypothetical protein
MTSGHFREARISLMAITWTLWSVPVLCGRRSLWGPLFPALCARYQILTECGVKLGVANVGVLSHWIMSSWIILQIDTPKMRSISFRTTFYAWFLYGLTSQFCCELNRDTGRLWLALGFFGWELKVRIIVTNLISGFCLRKQKLESVTDNV